MKTINKEYIGFLDGLEKVELPQFLNDFKAFDGLSSFRNRETYLNKNVNAEILNILQTKEFIDIFYLEPQAKYIADKLNLTDLKMLGTLVYCYNTNEREFTEKIELNKLEADLRTRGFEKISIFSEERDLRALDKIKVICVLDVSKIGILGSFDEKIEKEGTLVYSEYNKGLMLMPKRHTKTGHLIRKDFYIKRID